MEDSPPLSLCVPVPSPARGGCTRIRLGGGDLVLEHVRGGHTLLWSDGRESRRYVLGLRNDGELQLRWTAPRLPVRCVVRDVLSVVPGGRLRGYLQLPLVPTLVWTGADGGCEVLIELLPRDLTAEWGDDTGHLFRCPSPWLVRFPMRSGEPKVVVPIVLRNDDGVALSPAHLPLTLRDEDLKPMRGSVVVRPFRLRWRHDAWVGGPGREVLA
jgi:hypothetical protein